MGSALAPTGSDELRSENREMSLFTSRRITDAACSLSDPDNPHPEAPLISYPEA